jgi:hypothetical protein
MGSGPGSAQTARVYPRLEIFHVLATAASPATTAFFSPFVTSIVGRQSFVTSINQNLCHMNINLKFTYHIHNHFLIDVEFYETA